MRKVVVLLGAAMRKENAYFITTAIDYTNAAPHIGHAYEKVLADTLARYHRLAGRPVFFLTGVDQHGQKVQQSAEKEGKSPREFAAGITARFRALWDMLDVRPDGWAETSDPRHARAVQGVLRKLCNDGELYKATHTGFYSVRQEQFLTDKERGPDGEFGPEWGEVVELAEENWYFKLSHHRQWLLEFLRKTPGFVTPSFRQAELMNAVEKLSGDLCISRPKTRLDWGIELPFDRDYVTYVWFDALLNYVTFIGYGKAAGDDSLPEFEDWWPCNAHVIGKDILVPAHGIYWPIMLHAMGVPDEKMPRLLVHGWWNVAGTKMSKSLGNMVDPAALVEKFGVSALRYYLMRDIATGQDADFSLERLVERYNADLANDLGNLLNRSLSMIRRYRAGVIRRGGSGDPRIATLLAKAGEAACAYVGHMESSLPQAALEAVIGLASECNGFIEATAPWKLAKDASAAPLLDDVLHTLAECMRRIAILLEPVLPEASKNILAQINWRPQPSDALTARLEDELPDGHLVGEPLPLFPRIESAAADV